MPDTITIDQQLAISRRENRRLLAVVGILEAQLQQVADCRECVACSELAAAAIRQAGKETGEPEGRQKNPAELSKKG
jgi:hypothetical protein